MKSFHEHSICGKRFRWNKYEKRWSHLYVLFFQLEFHQVFLMLFCSVFWKSFMSRVFVTNVFDEIIMKKVACFWCVLFLQFEFQKGFLILFTSTFLKSFVSRVFMANYFDEIIMNKEACTWCDLFLRLTLLNGFLDWNREIMSPEYQFHFEDFLVVAYFDVYKTKWYILFCGWKSQPWVETWGRCPLISFSGMKDSL